MVPGLAVAGSPGKSSPMRLGAAAIPPLGYLQFCHQRPEECAAPDQAPAAPSPSAVELVRADLGATAELAAKPLPFIRPTAFRSDLKFNWPMRPITITLEPWAFETRATPAAASGSVVRIGLTSAMSDLQTLKAQGDVTARGRTRVVGDGLQLTKASWKRISAINEQINRSMAQRSDLEVYGTEEKWALPLEDGLRAGDCEDFALEKRHALIAAGIPRSALNLAVAITPQGVAHTVLIVSSDRGDFVLDSLTPWILPWSKTGYQWRQRQVAGQSMRWAMVEDPSAKPERLILASLR
ncbi:transglutaminase-like cysteine peptidase [Phenylobacterium conjunctum]